MKKLKEWLSRSFVIWLLLGCLIAGASISDYHDFSDKATKQLRQYKYITINGTNYATDYVTKISMRHYGTFRLEMTDGTIVCCDQYTFTDHLHN